MPGPVHRVAATSHISLPRRRDTSSHFRLSAPELQSHEFEIPSKKLRTESQINEWLESEAFVRVMDFVQGLNDSVIGMQIPTEEDETIHEWDEEACTSPDPSKRKIYVSPSIDALLMFLNEINELIERVPLREREMGRMGNVAFTTWINILEQSASNFLSQLLRHKFNRAVPELVPYLAQSFGNGQRRDYGSGHELNFVALLCCLDILGFVGDRDYPAIVLMVFSRYLSICRTLQIKYNLEPAGSHGVWGLDDHQFMAFIFGSAQLRENPTVKTKVTGNDGALGVTLTGGKEHTITLRPRSIVIDDHVTAAAPRYMYFGCISHIKTVKRGPFSEHSPMLYDISSVPTWLKVNTGLLKMYLNEVLAKFPVVQHFLFGSLLPLRGAIENESKRGAG
ncbi:hypothetical protein HDU93_004140 [Gonapodya sp. JEL0774]|nr:hypothetical protein HDU93_004140 [Gonapodya sp. JEL0774]